MLLVYFDNAQLAVLAAARRGRPEEYCAFLECWKRVDGRIAFSWLHLHEIRRYQNAEGRRDRYAVLEDLAPVHIDFPVDDDVPPSLSQLTNREAITVLFRKGWISTDDDFIERNGQAFPTVLRSSEELAGLQIYEGKEFKALADAFYAAAELGARAKSRPSNVHYDDPRLAAIPDVTPTKEDVEEFAAAFRNSLENDLKFEELRGIVSDEQIAAAKDHVLEAMNAFMEDAASHGVRKALAAAYSTSDEYASILKTPVKHLRQAHLFRSQVREGLADLMPGIEDQVLEDLVSAVSIDDCPGHWLRNAVSEQVEKAFPQDHPSNLFDINHIGYLPYVDLLFCDKRISEVARQVLRLSGRPDSLRTTQPPVAVANTVRAIIEALGVAAQNRERNHGA